MESLQAELMMDILSRVPTPELLKLTFVCRRWRNIILNDPLFRRLHHARLMSNPEENLVLLVKRRSELYWVDLTDKTSPLQVVINLPRIPNFSDYHFIGSCNGLLCLVNRNCKSILVMNPFIRHHVVIPMPRVMVMYPFAWWGFGFDEATKLFKVVGVFSRDLEILKDVKVRVYDLGSANSKKWRSIVVVNFPSSCTMDMDRYSCFFNGRLHWTYWTDWTEDKSLGIISFDLTDEEFKPIPTPDNPLFLEPIHDYLIVYGGCLCLLKIQTRAIPPELLIWVMKEYEIKASWVMELNIYPSIFTSLDPNQYYGSEVLGFGKDGELVVSEFNERSEESIFLSSDLTCDEFKRLQLERQPSSDLACDEVWLPQFQRRWNGSIIHTATLNWI